MNWIEKAFQERQSAGINYTLARMEALMMELGHPQEELPVIHIAGTNGKGSTVIFTDALLRDAGKKTAAFMTPSLGERHEQVYENGFPIKEIVFAEALEIVLPAVRTVEKARGEMITPFELLTAAAFTAAARVIKADVFLVEAGMGGRLDATNITAVPACTVITSIGTDHLDYLGGTRESAAREKAGIMRRGVPCIAAADQKANEWLKEEADKYGALFKMLPEDWAYEAPNRFIFRGESLQLQAPGEHQARNARTAVAAAETVTAVKSNVLEQVFLPGRWEAFAQNAFFDTAHNIEAVQALTASIPEEKRVTFLTAVMRDKPAEEMMRLLSGRGTVHVCEMPDPRGLTQTEWAERAPELFFQSSPAAFIDHWLEASSEKEMLVVTGSHAFIQYLKRERKSADER